MRKIDYIFIDSDTENDNRLSSRPAMPDLRHQLSSLGPYHFIVNSEGCVIPLTDLHRTRELIPGPIYDPDKYNRCSIFIRYIGNLRPETWLLESSTSLKPASRHLKQREALINLLVQLRQSFPTAKILGLSELNGKELHSRNIIVSDAMNLLRKELSNLP